MEYPTDRKYSEQHEWLLLEGPTARIGITDYAQDALGDVVYVQLPDVGLEVLAHSACAEVESTKSVSEIYAPISGEVSAVNTALDSEPELLNRDPYGGGWIFTVTIADPSEADTLLDAAAYQHLVEEA